MIKRRKRVTIADVAKVAKISTMTVSRVINNKAAIKPETRQRVMRVIRDLDYEPNHIAQSLTGSRSYTIGVIVVDIANPFFAEITAGIETVSWQHNYNVILCNTQEDPRRERQVLRMLEAKQVDGVIVCSTRLPTPICRHCWRCSPPPSYSTAILRQNTQLFSCWPIRLALSPWSITWSPVDAGGLA